MSSPNAFRTSGINASVRPGSESRLRFMRPPRRNLRARAPEPGFELTRVLVEEHRHDALQEDAVEVRHARGVRHRDGLEAVTGPRADQEVLAALEQLDGRDGHRLWEGIELKHRRVEDAVER